MEIRLLEHVNLRTANLDRLEKWYCQVLGLKPGYRPPFKSTGRWLYAGDIPMVHLLYIKEQKATEDPTMEHFAMRASGLKDFLNIIKEMNIPYRTVRVPELRAFQIYISDPDGNNMHIDFQPDEADELGYD
jgi:catechol-2,3-dioxygenase